MFKPSWKTAPFIASVAILAIVLIVAAASAFRQPHERPDGIAAVALLDPACDLHRADCQSVFADGSRITLSIGPRPVRALQPLQLEVTTAGLEPVAVAVDFQGLSMAMGYNRPSLQAAAPDRYTGKGMLASCVLRQMRWQATVLVTTHAGIWAAPFQFEISQP